MLQVKKTYISRIKSNTLRGKESIGHKYIEQETCASEEFV